jgi:hypothetical protein
MRRVQLRRTPAGHPVVRDAEALRRHWRAVLAIEPYLERILWMLFLDHDRRASGPLLSLDGVPDGPYAYEVADLARLARQLIDGPGDATSVAFAMTRPGGDPWTVSDRAWGRFLHATSAEVGGTVWPAHLAHPKRLERYVLPTR